MEMSVPRQMSHCTVRLTCQLSGGSTSIGTGFHFDFCENGTQCVPGIVTNRHVVEGAESVKFHLTVATSQYQPDIGKSFWIEIPNFSNRWLPHPDSTVDLAVIPIGGALTQAARNGTSLYRKSIKKDIIPSDTILSTLSALDEVIMVGYPIGLWDSQNNMPLFRRGVAATHPNLNYEGKAEFLIDAACFPGSSGSPVFYYDKGFGMKSGGGIVITGGEPRLYFLGVLYAGPQFTVEGNIVVRTVPTHQIPMSLAQIPMNLGIVIKSQRVLEFEQLFQSAAPAESAPQQQNE